MALSAYAKQILVITGSAFLCRIAYLLYRKARPQYDSVNEMLFYGTKEDSNERNGLNNLMCIHYLIVHATTSINVCVPKLTSETLTNSLIKSRKKSNVSIRVIIHNDFDYDDKLLKDNLIEVKMMHTYRGRMEHEFILIDAESDDHDAVAIIGSLDYAVGRRNCNQGNTMVTSDWAVVTALQREFERLWHSSSTFIQNYYSEKSMTK